MPDDRLFHKKLGHSVKVNALTDFEEIVWRTYIQAADDFGVMRYMAPPLQDAYRRLAIRPTKAVLRALDRVHELGLIHTFMHQGQRYCYQRTWQDYQKIEYPRTAINPVPPPDELELCSPATQYLFSFHPGGCRIASQKTQGRVPELSVNAPGTFRELSQNIPVPRARGRTLTANANGLRLTVTGGVGGTAEPPHTVQPSEASEELSERAARFCERYSELYAEHRHGARYHNKPSLDYLEALGLVSIWDDVRLEQLAIAFFTTDEPFCRNGSGTIAQFRSRASWCDARLKERGL